ncbi:MAG: hypothetical protein A3D44_03075 [Candidatus Staskawiczbacteria bacterium RIFCSPHIGHO2_02_FULL_42_22]|uniref:Glycosyltransferase family 1 protein n=1 Tax=Candidatus Staskawiczbacteria bacterium RIFCSPHIGHO2_02_FULL_42_22 TaxID=1802207 RepID=A0A1G2I544_9BACT|nr:MAG: hypothetical protein A3D44_03075 [Candidatus Staskawiczbacteria bacterium RIFCSPHIGHO2_02_FULL_42_22]
MRNHKICFVAAVDITIKFLLFSELKFFKNKGYDVCVVCSPGKWLQDIKKEGITVKEITIKRNIFSPVSDVISFVKLFLYFRKERFDLVLTYTPKPGLLGCLAAKVAGVPIVANTIFGYYFHERTSYLKKRFFIFIEKVSAKCCDIVFFRNKEDFETSKKERIVKPALAEYIGDGIDIEKFNRVRFSPDFIQEKKKELGINLGVPIIGIVARLVREKGYMELLAAFERVLVKFPNALLLVVGSADLQKKDSVDPRIIKSFGIEKSTILLGERIDVDELFSVMDMFVLPSYREGFPHSIMEASAMALPVVTTDVRGCRSAVDGNITGLIVPPKDSDALAQSLINLLSNTGAAKRMGKLGRIKAQQEFDERILFRKMEEKINKLIKNA